MTDLEADFNKDVVFSVSVETGDTFTIRESANMDIEYVPLVENET